MHTISFYTIVRRINALLDAPSAKVWNNICRSRYDEHIATVIVAIWIYQNIIYLCKTIIKFNHRQELIGNYEKEKD